MILDTNINRYEIYAQTTPVSGHTLNYGFVHSNRQVYSHIEFDIFLPIFLSKTYDYYEYVSVKKDDTIIPIVRQEVNPYFVELSFFDDVSRVGLRDGFQLTNSMVEFIRTRRVDLQNYTNQEIRAWFNNVGIYELPWNRGQSNETTLVEIETKGTLIDTIIGKAQLLNININT